MIYMIGFNCNTPIYNSDPFGTYSTAERYLLNHAFLNFNSLMSLERYSLCIHVLKLYVNCLLTHIHLC